MFTADAAVSHPVTHFMEPFTDARTYMHLEDFFFSLTDLSGSTSHPSQLGSAPAALDPAKDRW